MTTTEETTAGVGNWGRWGPDDERGALNLMTPEVVLAATRVCRTGKVYSLALPIGKRLTPEVLGTNRPGPDRLTLCGPADAPAMELYGAAPGVGSNEDLVIISSHAGTHMDALCHVFSDGTIWNGHPAGSFTPAGGAGRCGITNTASFAGRAVLLDVAAHQGVDTLEPGQVITADDLEACRAAQGVEMGSGDVLIVRTGCVEQGQRGGPPSVGQAGLGFSAVDFVRDHDVAVVAADNRAVEPYPFDRDVFLGVHIDLLVKLGVTLVEHLWLGELAADRCYESLFIIGALPVAGATGSPVNPIAIG